MGIFDKLGQLLGGFFSSPGGTSSDPRGLLLYVRCAKCGSITRVRVDKRNDLNREPGPGTFLLRKEVMDDKCFQIMKATIWLDSSYRVVSSDVQGGELVSEEEYSAAQAD